MNKVLRDTLYSKPTILEIRSKLKMIMAETSEENEEIDLYFDALDDMNDDEIMSEAIDAGLVDENGDYYG